MVANNLGAKRICIECGAKFYDLGKNPANCPKCGKSNDITAVARARRGRAKPVIAVDDDEPLVKEKSKAETRQKAAKKPVDDEDVDSEEEIEELEEIEDIDAIDEIDETVVEGLDDEDIVIEDDADEDALIDDIESEEESDVLGIDVDEPEEAPRGTPKSPKKPGKK